MKPDLPARIDRYEVTERLGRGGMGVVYLATDPALGRTVAVKMLTEDNEELRERFAREARSAAALKHNNIVTIYDVGDHEGRPFIAMEYLDGDNLAEIIRRREPVPLRQKLDWIVELCAGLGYAHRSNIVHRDIKPANLLITREGTLKILDFGIARVTAEATNDGLTRVGMLMGSPHYMSPEQAEGQPVDERSDIFAVGLVLYELLCGERAFPGDTPHVVLNSIMTREPRSIVEFCPDLDPELVAIVNRGLIKDRNGRYQTLAAMSADLQRFRDRSGTPADGTALIQRGPERTGARPPAAHTPTPGMLDTNALARRRAAEISRHLDDASGSFRAGRYEAAIEHCEKALVIDPQEARATEILQLTYRAMETRQIRQWLGEAETLIAEGALTGAERLVTQALKMQPDSLEAQTTMLDLRERRRQRDRPDDPSPVAESTQVAPPRLHGAHVTDVAGMAGLSPSDTKPPIAVAQTPTVAAPPPPIVKGGDGRHLAIIALLVLMIGGGVAGYWWMNRPSAPPPVQAETPPATPTPAPPSDPPVASPTPPPVNYDAVMSEALRLQRDGATEAAARELARIPADAAEYDRAQALLAALRERPSTATAKAAPSPTAAQSPDPAKRPAVVEAAPRNPLPAQPPPVADTRVADIRNLERQLKQSLTAQDTAGARGHLEAIRRIDRSYAGVSSLEALIRDAEAVAAKAKEAALAEERDREARRREADAAAEAAKRSPAAENAARSAIRQVLTQFAQVFNGDNGRKAEGFKKLWPSMTAADLAALTSLDTDKAPRDWRGAEDRAEILFDGKASSAVVTWTISLSGKDRGSSLISHEQHTARFEMSGGAIWTITRLSITR